MIEHAYIKWTDDSGRTGHLEELKKWFHDYKAMAAKTGEQLNWTYEEAAFPYSLQEKNFGGARWLVLNSDTDRYHSILFRTGHEEETGQSFIEAILPQGSTHGDKGKANELCKFLAGRLNAELHLFNKRVMHFSKKK